MPSPQANPASQRGHPIFRFGGALVSKVAPIAVQVVLLFYVARVGTLDDVGVLALGSAAAFMCAALAEIGFGTSLSVPRAYFDTRHPPLSATRRLRIGAAAAGSCLYAALWAAGLGDHRAALLILVPLPFALAMAYGHGGALNAGQRLGLEGRVTAVESVAILVFALGFTLVMPGLEAALLGLVTGRASGAVGRAWILRGAAQETPALSGRALVRKQLLFVPATVLIVLQGQIDVLALGFLGSLTLVAVYAPMVRITYTPVILAEALSWALFSEDERGDERATLERRWYLGAVIGGVALAAIVAVFGDPVLELLLDREVSTTPALQVLALVIPIRFLAFTQTVAIVRAGAQGRRVPFLALAVAVLLVGSVVGGIQESLLILAVSRVATELCLGVGYTRVVRLLPRTSRTPLAQVPA